MKTKDLKISVVIPTYNRSEYLKKAIASVYGQTFKNLEIIVVDDGSTDDTEQTVKSFDNSIIYVKQKNLGPGAARNKGVFISHGDWIAFLDSDDNWFPKKLQIQIKESMINKMDVCFHDVSVQISGTEPFIGSWNEYISKELNRDALKTGILEKAFETIVNTSHLFLTSTMLIKREVYIGIGGMNEDLRTNQDIEFYYRLAPRYKIGFIDKVLAHYSPGNQRAYEVASNREQRKSRKGKPRVYLDRIDSLKLAFSDRKKFNDKHNMQVVIKSIKEQMRNLAGEYRKKKMFLNAIKMYVSILCFSFKSLRNFYTSELRNKNL